MSNTMSDTRRYTVLLSDLTAQRIQQYAQDLRADRDQPGARLADVLGSAGAPDHLVPMLQALFLTRKPQIFAESAVCGDGSDWSLRELGLLGDISVAIPVQVHDDGTHRQPKIHAEPIEATLLFTPGALLDNGNDCTPADWNEVVRDNALHGPGFVQLYERRLLPVLLHADQEAARRGRRALITVPGLGCGAYAGDFSGKIEPHLIAALKALLHKHAARLTHVALVRFDPYRSTPDSQDQFGAPMLRVRALQDHPDTPQLCAPRDYEEAGDDFSDCDLFSVVAWDHVSWPGNDFYVGQRKTDDGVKAAATTAMHQMTGVEGQYDTRFFMYRPPAGFTNWEAVIKKNGLCFTVTAAQVCVHPLD
ncbi:DUF4804 domain-containing protein [Sphaerotilus uruguayifluvii]|uniref:Macrodomain effector MavL domain-containing protein n=1 Tax=Sphaerotilus uruguayifluvii TaxID=2735897 RepID=A0ABX2G6W8_9BURK|nr:DUF4804 domain-containing protein [Leptothrix sp. C29]NRT58039.1 hypothetical protein [Leptothrix sp. C29]